MDTWTKTVIWSLKKKPANNKLKCKFLRIYQNILEVWNVSITMNFGLVALHASKQWFSGGTLENDSNSEVCLVESWSLIGSGIKVWETAWSIYLLMITKESLLSLLHSLFLTNIWSWFPLCMWYCSLELALYAMHSEKIWMMYYFVIHKFDK